MAVPTKLTPTKLRADLYRILDEVLRTGKPVEIDRNGRTLRIEAVEGDDRLSRLTPHPESVVGDLDSLDRIDWSEAWKP